MQLKQQASDAIARYLERNRFDRFEPKAALIDMDGTLLDSMKLHTIAWQRMISECGIACTRDEFYLYEGMTGAETINMIFKRELHREATPTEKVELYARKTAYFNEMPRPSIIPDADKVLSSLMQHNIMRVLVTGSGQLSNLERLNVDFPGAFSADLRITSHNVTHCKPHPEPYLNGMKLAHVEPWQAIALENAPLGVKSAADAGAFTIAVTTGPIPEQNMWDAGANLVLPSMTALLPLLPYLLK